MSAGRVHRCYLPAADEAQGQTGATVNALVTGAAGFIGSHLAEALLAAGGSVVGVDNFNDYYGEQRKRWNLAPCLDDDDFRFVEGDLTEIALEPLLEEANVVYHLAGQPGVRASWGENFEIYLRENVLATQRLLECAKSASIGRFVYTSSSSIYGQAERFPTPEDAVPRPVSPYGATKLAGEHLCELYASSYEVPVTTLRYFTVYGPRQRPDMAISRFVDAALANRPATVFGDGRQIRDFTYVDDIVDATLAAGRDAGAGGVYNIAGGSQVNVLDVIAAVETALGTGIEVQHRPLKPGEPRRTGGDTSAARRDLGFDPATDFTEGVAAQVEAQRELSAASL